MTSRWLKSGLWLLVLPVLCCALYQPLRSQTASAPVYVTLWFDTEDYILPQSDDAAKRLAETLTKLGVKATFKMVGEKARVLQQRGRTDVIAALQQHDIGYHTNWHSRQPTVSVYLQNSGWEDGIAEFLRRERSGAEDVKRIFGVTPVCYGQPGGAWAPQAYPALRTLGIHVYLDEAEHVGLDGQPFYYGGMLNVFNMDSALTRMELDGPENLSRAREQFQKACEILRAKGGGTISIYYHPCEFVHAQFWDGVNFSHGNNPPRSEWKLPPTKPAAQAEKGFSDFEQYIRFIKGQPGVRFATATDLKVIYADGAAEHRFTRAEVVTLAQGVRSGITFQRIGDIAVSAADVLSILTREAADFTKAGALPASVKADSLDGPARTFVVSGRGVPPGTIPWSAFSEAIVDVAGFCQDRSRVPSEVWIGAYSIPPETYLATLAGVVEEVSRTGQPLAEVRIINGTLTAEKYVAKDSPGLWNWPIFPEGFHAPAIMELGRLQAWTLKPAILKR
jgi:hypothetical protein